MRGSSRRCFPTRRRSWRTCSRVCSSIAKADGPIDAAEADYLAEVARIFGLSSARFERAKAAALGVVECEPCIILGIDPLATDEQIREAWLRQVKANHPDRLMAQGLPEEAIAMANRKLALINDAYDRLRRERGLVPACRDLTASRCPSPNHAPRADGGGRRAGAALHRTAARRIARHPARRQAARIASARTMCWPRTAPPIGWCPRIASPGMPAARTGAAAKR